VVTEKQVHPVLDAIERSAKTGKIGDGKVFVLGVEEALRIRTGERGEPAI
jgi:nitrogen regulatory protein P-II 1